MIEQPSPERSRSGTAASLAESMAISAALDLARAEAADEFEFCEPDWPALDAARAAQSAGGSRAVFAEMQATLDSVEGAQIETNRMFAAQFEQVRRAFALAASHPELYVLPVVDEPARVAEIAARAVAAELSMRLQLPASTIRNRAYEAETLQQRLPRVWCRFRDGLASYADVRVALEAVAGFLTGPQHPGTDSAADSAVRRAHLDAFDEALAEAIGRITTTRFRQRAKVLRARFEGAAETTARHVRAASERRVIVEHDDRGMAWVQLYTTSIDAARIHARLNATAAESAGAPGEHRTTDQLRADLATAWLAGDGTPTAVRTEVVVTVPVLSLIGATLPGDRPDPAELEGVGPIDEARARQLFADAPTFLRLAVDPLTGAPLNLGRTRYRVTKAQRRWLELKYGRCTRPGCNRLAISADVDHLVDWLSGGRTDEPNLAPTCRPDHGLKHLTNFTVASSTDGSIRWRSPFGFTAETAPNHTGRAGRSTPSTEPRVSTRMSASTMVNTSTMMNASAMMNASGPPAPATRTNHDPAARPNRSGPPGPAGPSNAHPPLGYPERAPF
ncbi:DUF222 domain-containing protein [Agromyces soli]